MKKIMLLLMMVLVLSLAACDTTSDIKCGAGTQLVDGKCVAPQPVEETCADDEVEVGGVCVKEQPVDDTCNDGYHKENGNCVPDEPEEVTCGVGYHEENGQCVLDLVDAPDWFTGWTLLTEPIGDLPLSALNFTETGFSVSLPAGKRIGIKQGGMALETGFYYEVSFDYSSDVPNMGLFVQLQGHGGYHFTLPNILTGESQSTFTEILAIPPSYGGTNNGSLVIELLPNGVPGTMTIENITVNKIALPTCGENEELDGITCIPANNGFIPNGTPTAWFEGWEILTLPAGNKEVSDLDFTETGYTVYLGEGDRSGIQLMNYNFESGYKYEFTFTYTASVEGRLVWVQMEALGGYGFTNTETWTVNGIATFTQTLEIPTSYTPVEPGWIKLELAPGAQDNITIENIEIIKTPIN